MSKARSPREVCSTTIGINGLICSSLLATWCPQLRLGRLALLLRRPDALTRGGKLGRDRFDLRRDPVERLLHPQVVAHAVRPALLDELLDVLVRLAGLTQLLADLVVRHLEAELVRDRLEHEFARNR